MNIHQKGPGPLAPKARIIPLYLRATLKYFLQFLSHIREHVTYICSISIHTCMSYMRSCYYGSCLTLRIEFDLCWAQKANVVIANAIEICKVCWIEQSSSKYNIAPGQAMHGMYQGSNSRFVIGLFEMCF